MKNSRHLLLVICCVPQIAYQIIDVLIWIRLTTTSIGELRLIDLRGALRCIWRHKFIQIDHEHESTYRCAILLQVPFIVVVRAGLLVTVAAYQCTVAGSVVERVCRKQDGKLNCQYSDKNMLRFLPNRQRTITLLLAFVTRASSFSNLYSLSQRIMRRRIEQYMKSSGKY
jgi:hypothetical protein